MLIFFLFLFINASSILCTLTNDTDTLTKFRQSADRHGNLAINWSTSNACTWTGVACSPIAGRVISLSLPQLDLQGPLDILSRLDQLRFLDLHGNHLNGTLFPVISSLSNLKVIRLYRNDISGSIPQELGLLTHLVHVDISQNKLEGPIVSSMFSNLSRLLTFCVQNNYLSGHVPDLTVVLPKLSEFNVSNNMLYGSVPHAMIKKFKITSFLGNEIFSLTPQFVISSISNSVRNGSRGSPSSGSGDTKRPRIHLIVLIVIGNVVFIIVLILLLVAFCFYFDGKMWENKHGSKVDASQKEVGENGSKQMGTKDDLGEESEYYEEKGEVVVQSKLVFFRESNSRDVFGLEELLHASAEMIGKGGTGIVYKAALENGSINAVKRLKNSNTCSHDEFRRCIDIIGKVTHPNVLTLKAYYYAPQERLLIYDYLPKGSLYSLLHGNRRNTRRTQLDWTTRIELVLESARGLAYIHQNYGSHGNIKSSNILVDINGFACISDFGHALLVDPTRVIAKSGGYIAPEQKACIKSKRKEILSKEADVYAFGVVILEMLTGNEASQYPSSTNSRSRNMNRHRNDITLPKWVELVVNEEWSSEVFDPELMACNNDEEEMMHMLHVAMMCVDSRAENRPKMIDVVKLIEDIGIEEH